MKNIMIPGIIFLSVLISCKDAQKAEKPNIQEEIKEEVKEDKNEFNFYTSDSIKIYGDVYELDKKVTTILLFHQGGSNARGEYVSIIPKLIDEGYNVMTIDQRVGGQIYGNYNRTIANIPDNSFDNNYTYCDAYNNLEGALDFSITSGFTGKKILWGSSYSASLAIQLAQKRQEDIAGVLAFSPATGGAMKDCLPDEYIKTLTKPLLILRPPNEMENVKKQFDLALQYNHQAYAAKYGVHGSSMLVKERVGNDVDENWKVVFDFLNTVKDK